MKPEMMEPGIREGKIGSLLFVTDPATINRFQKVAVEQSRLKIPLLFGFDVIHGFRTIFPVPLALASSWDVDLVERVQTIAAREASATGIRWTFAPMLDIARVGAASSKARVKILSSAHGSRLHRCVVSRARTRRVRDACSRA
jgi:beta-glucosidase